MALVADGALSTRFHALFCRICIAGARTAPGAAFRDDRLLSGQAVGSTRYHHVDPEHRRLEIGVTWISPAHQRSHVNTETKLLQFWYAIDVLKCRRVELKADVDNARSRAAILRLGAMEEGIFRKHMLYADGRNRDNVYFSVIDDDWPAVRARLEGKLGYVVIPTYVR